MPNINKVVYGNTTLIDLTDTTAEASDVASGKYFYGRDGVKTAGTASGGGTAAISIVDTPDAGGGDIRTITALDISDSTLLTADQLLQGVTAYNKLGEKLTGTATGGGGSVTQDAQGYIVLPSTGSGGGGSAQTKTGTFVGNDGNVITIQCEFAPDLIYIRGDLTGSVSLRGICSVTIIKDTVMYVTADSSTSSSDEYMLYGAHGITGYNTDTSYPYATYSNGVLSVDTVQNSGTARWNSSVTYGYNLVKWS